MKEILRPFIKTIPYRHQKKAFRIGVALEQCALLMEQGTGKTLPAIGVSGYRLREGQVRKLLVVAPLSVIDVWHDEFYKHASFPYRLVDLTKKDNDQRKLDLAFSSSDRLKVALINYESIWRCIDLLIKWEPDMVIVDESQKIKNYRAKQSRAIHRLGDRTTYKMILSGTPITQGPLDTWSQYRFLDPDIFGRRYRTFRDRYAIMGGYGGYQIKGYRHLNELARKAHNIAYRITKAEALDLPETIDQELTVNLSPATMRIYKEMEKDFLVKFSETEVTTAPIILTQLLRLQQITGGFLPTDDKVIKQLDSAKLNAVKELLEDLPSNKKVVIFARFVSEIEALRKVSESLGRNPVVLSGGTKYRDKIVRSFQENQRTKDIIIQVQTGGLGITLTAADTAVFYSTTFSFADYDQAKARLHRIGQRNSVTYIHILAGGTIDEHVIQILKDKGNIAAQIVDRLRKVHNGTSTKVPFTHPSPSLIIKRNKTKGGMNMIGLDTREKGGWYWDETTGRIIRVDAENGKPYCLAKVDTLEEAQERVRQLEEKTNKYLKGETQTMASKKKETKKAQKPEEVMEEAVEELEEVVEETKATPTKKTKKERKAEKKAAAEVPTPTKKSKKAEKKATPAPAPKAEKKTTATDAATNEISAKELAAQLNIDPKVLRKTLREMFPDHESKDRWVWKKGSKELERLIKKLQK